MNVLGYSRVSTDHQEANGHGLDAQEHRIREACDQQGWTLTDLIREGASGKDLRREGLQDALSRLARHEAEGLVVAKMDRLSRSLLDFAALLDWFRDAGVVFVALDFDLDTSTPTGELLSSILVMVGQWERRAGAQRTKDALAAKRLSGQPINQGAVSDHAELAARIRAWRFDERLTFRQICERLNDEKVPTTRGGALWRPSAVQGVLGGVRRPARRRAAVLPEIRR